MSDEKTTVPPEQVPTEPAQTPKTPSASAPHGGVAGSQRLAMMSFSIARSMARPTDFDTKGE